MARFVASSRSCGCAWTLRGGDPRIVRSLRLYRGFSEVVSVKSQCVQSATRCLGVLLPWRNVSSDARARWVARWVRRSGVTSCVRGALAESGCVRGSTGACLTCG